MPLINVLIVEDDPMVAELNRLYLNQVSGFHLAGVVSNGEEALNFLRTNDTRLILLDLFMPNIDGMDFLNRVRSMGRKLDVIMVTAARDSSNIETALRNGVVDYVVKPFNCERLKTALVTYRERTRLLEQNGLLNQQEIDHGILTKSMTDQSELPKGLERDTLQIVAERLLQMSDFITIQQLSRQVGISRVSLRKYLKYLKDIGRVEVKLTYQAIGRPVNMYRYQK